MYFLKSRIDWIHTSVIYVAQIILNYRRKVSLFIFIVLHKVETKNSSNKSITRKQLFEIVQK